MKKYDTFLCEIVGIDNWKTQQAVFIYKYVQNFTQKFQLTSWAFLYMYTILIDWPADWWTQS